MSLTVKKIIAALAVINILAIIYFMAISTSSPAGPILQHQNIKHSDYSFSNDDTSSALQDGQVDSQIPDNSPQDDIDLQDHGDVQVDDDIQDQDDSQDNDSPQDKSIPQDDDSSLDQSKPQEKSKPLEKSKPQEKIKSQGNSSPQVYDDDYDDADDFLTPDDQDAKDIVKADLKVDGHKAGDHKTDDISFKSSLDLPYEGIINPFRVLGFYKECEPDKYFAPVYKRRQKSFDDVHHGIRINANYCDHSDLYNLFNSSNLFDHMNFVPDYSLTGNEKLPRVDVMDKIGTSVMPWMTEPWDKENLKDMDLRATMYFTKSHEFHYSHKIGKHFLCAFQMYNHLPGESIITRKDHLTGTVNAYAEHYASKPECFNKNTMVPYSHRLRNETECNMFFSEINSPEYYEKKLSVPLQYIIKKGFGAHKGTGVYLFDEEQEKFIRAEYANGALCGKLDESFVAQRYIANPILLDKKNKFDFRMYMLVASIDPIILYYHDGFLRVSLTEYDLNSTERSTHLTNTHLSKEKFADAAEGNETLEEALREYQMWTLEELQEYLLEIEKITDPDWLNNYLRPQFKKAYIHIIRMSRHRLWTHSSVYEMFGLDFILDEDFNLWLIECNSSPQLIGTTATKQNLMVNMLTDLFEIEYAYLRSKMKRLLIIAREFSYKVFSGKPVDLEKERERFAKANKNFLEPEFKIRENSTWVKIYDENIPGKAKYMGHIEDECILDA